MAVIVVVDIMERAKETKRAKRKGVSERNRNKHENTQPLPCDADAISLGIHVTSH